MLLFDQSGSNGNIIWHTILLLAWICRLLLNGLQRRGFRPLPRGWAIVPIIACAAIPALVQADNHYQSLIDWYRYSSLIALAWLVWEGQYQRWAWRACLGGAAIQIFLAWGQVGWVFPAMAELIASAQLNTGSTTIDPDLIAERIRNGGSYGTLLLANGLAIVLAALTFPICTMFWHGQIYRFVLPAIALFGLSGLILCGAKGAFLALGVGTLWWLAAQRPARQQMLYAIVALVLLTVVAFIPILREPFAASFAVRIAYWQAAWQLVELAPFIGHGWNAYDSMAAPLMTADAEVARLPHNAWLSAWVSGGIILAAPLLFLYCRVWWPRPNKDEALSEPGSWSWRPWCLLLIIPYFGLVDELLQSDNLSYWPGSYWLWLLVVASVFAVITSIPWPQPSRLGVRAALTCLLLGALIDFHFHNVGVLMFLALLTPLSWRPSLNSSRRQRVAATLFLTVFGFSSIVLLPHSADLAQSRQRIELVTQLQQAIYQRNYQQSQTLWQRLIGKEPSSAKEAQTLLDAETNYLLLQVEAWPTDTTLILDLAPLFPNPHTGITLLRQHWRQLQFHALAWSTLGDCYGRLQQWQDCFDAYETALLRSPQQQGFRDNYWNWLNRALKEGGSTGQQAIWLKRWRQLHPQPELLNQL